MSGTKMSKDFFAWSNYSRRSHYYDFDDKTHIILFECSPFEDSRFWIRLYDEFTLLFETGNLQAVNLEEAKVEALALCQSFIKEQVAKYNKLCNLICGEVKNDV